MGRPFSAILKLSFDDEIKNYKLEFDFGQDQNDENGEPPDFSDQEPVGACPKCGGRVYEHGMSYLCENSVANPKTCDFRSGKVILQQEMTREQMSKLLTGGRTDLLTGFKSSRTGRNFKAFLVKQPDGKIGFEFEKKEPSAKSIAAAAAKAAKAGAKGETGDDGDEGDQPAVASARAPAKKAAPAKAAAKAAPKPAAKKVAAKKVAAKKVAAKKTASA